MRYRPERHQRGKIPMAGWMLRERTERLMPLSPYALLWWVSMVIELRSAFLVHFTMYSPFFLEVLGYFQCFANVSLRDLIDDEHWSMAISCHRRGLRLLLLYGQCKN